MYNNKKRIILYPTSSRASIIKSHILLVGFADQWVLPVNQHVSNVCRVNQPGIYLNGSRGPEVLVAELWKADLVLACPSLGNLHGPVPISHRSIVSLAPEAKE